MDVNRNLVGVTPARSVDAAIPETGMGHWERRDDGCGGRMIVCNATGRIGRKRERERERIVSGLMDGYGIDGCMDGWMGLWGA